MDDGAWELIINASGIGDITDANDSLIIMGDAGDTLIGSETWTDSGNDTVLDVDGAGDDTYSIYQNGSYTIMVDDDIDVSQLSAS